MTALPTIRRADCDRYVLDAADAWKERDLQDAVMARAGAYGWRRIHSEPVLAQNRRGGFRHVTPFTGDAGWPDTAAVHPSGVLLVVELKQEGKYPDPDQRAWLELLAAIPGPVLAGVWRPRDWHSNVIDRVLRDPLSTIRHTTEV